MHAGLHVRWNSYLRPGACDAELIELMRACGCSLVLITGTGGYEPEGADLGAHLEQVRRLTTACRQGSLPFTLSMSFGDPSETPATVEQKLAFLRETAPAFATLRVATRVLPHTSLAQAALAEGLISSDTDLLRPTFYLAASMRDWLVEHLRAEATAQPRWNLT